jgi:hypothetical protein
MEKKSLRRPKHSITEVVEPEEEEGGGGGEEEAAARNK